MSFQEDFECIKHGSGKLDHDVWVGGAGPPLILMHELDGFGTAFIHLAERFAEQFRVYAPRFFGKVGEKEGCIANAKGLWHICIRSEFYAFKRGQTSRVTNSIRKLVKYAKEQNPEFPKVGVIGMCMTGGIVLATITHPSVGAGVAAQPALPLASLCFSSRKQKSDLGLGQEDLDKAKVCDTPLLVLRFEFDKISPPQRIHEIKRTFPNCQPPPQFLDGSDEHPTLTACYRSGISAKDQTRSQQAIDETINFLNTHLRA